MTFTAPAPLFEIPPTPLIRPARIFVVPVVLAATVRVLPKMIALLIVSTGFMVPEGLKVSVGVVPPLFTNCKLPPLKVNVAVPVAGPT